MMDTQGKFYLGRVFDPKKKATTEQPLLYDPDDLNTHAVVVGMTGSGKTGLCIGLLEEAALAEIPALMIDPKGDITNLLLHFPDLLPADFQPWIDADQARRSGQTVEQAAAAAASQWKDGLADWDVDRERLHALKEAAHFAVFTPGSDAGIPVNILASFAAPRLPGQGGREALREKISATVTALLGLIGLEDIDPVRSREHILLSNILEHAWNQGQDLNLEQLILQTQHPPFAKLGVFEVDTFFPSKDRFNLAMMLNNILAAPAFEAWIQGQSLDIESLLYGPDGRPRHSVFYIAHLGDAERMFFVTLLFSAIEAWMRAQNGSSALRALIYFDEIFGYLPPVKNPPSKSVIIRMLKQARAFGVGLTLVTQNPVDLDYKGLSNTGTWFIGKLQADQDKQRLLDGLEGAQPGVMDRGAYDRLISALGKRVFLLHNVHNKEPLLFQTRWVMNYLAGPLSRTQIPALNRLAGAVLPQAEKSPPAGAAAPSPLAGTPVSVQARDGAGAPPAAPTARPAASALQPAPVADWQARLSTERPALPAGAAEYILPANLSLDVAVRASPQPVPAGYQSLGLVYQPALLAQASVRFLNRRYNLDYEQRRAVLATVLNPRGIVRWEQFLAQEQAPQRMETQPKPLARFTRLEAPLNDGRSLAALQKDFLDWVYRTGEAVVRANEALDIYAAPDTSQADFRKMCSDKAQLQRDAEMDKARKAHEKKAAPLVRRLAAAREELDQDRSDLSEHRAAEAVQHVATVAGLLFKGRNKRISASMAKRRQTQRAADEVEQSLQELEQLQEQLDALQQELEQELAEIGRRWGDVASQVAEITIRPLKKDVYIDLFGIAWMPYHLILNGEQVMQLLATQEG